MSTPPYRLSGLNLFCTAATLAASPQVLADQVAKPYVDSPAQEKHYSHWQPEEPPQRPNMPNTGRILTISTSTAVAQADMADLRYLLHKR